LSLPFSPSGCLGEASIPLPGRILLRVLISSSLLRAAFFSGIGCIGRVLSMAECSRECLYCLHFSFLPFFFSQPTLRNMPIGMPTPPTPTPPPPPPPPPGPPTFLSSRTLQCVPSNAPSHSLKCCFWKCLGGVGFPPLTLLRYTPCIGGCQLVQIL